jgi:hypothetical protein
VATFGACSYTINDKIAQVCMQSMKTLNTVIDTLKCNKVSNPEYNSYLEQILVGLMIKIGDSKTQMRELAEETVMNIAKCTNIGPNAIVTYFIRTHGVPKVTNDFKHLKARLHSLTNLVKSFGVGNAEIPLNPVIDFAVRNIENSNNDVRQAAVELIVESFKIVGNAKLQPLLGGVRQNQMDILLNEFNNVTGVPQDDALRTEMENMKAKNSKVKPS